MQRQLEEWFLNSELQSSNAAGSSDSEKLAQIALAMNQPERAIAFLEDKELIAEIELLQGRTDQAAKTAEGCNRLFQERIRAQPAPEALGDARDLLSLLSLRVGHSKRTHTELFKDK